MSGWLFGGWPPPPPGAGGAVDIGDPVGGGSPNSVLFIDAAGKLAQDPGFFDYNKTTHTLNRKPSVLNLIESVPASNFTYGVPWGVSVAEVPFPNSIFDPVAYWGINLRTGQPIVVGKAAVGMGVEGNAPRNDDPTKGATEMHLLAIDELGLATRWLSMFNNHDGTKLEANLNGDVLNFFDKTNAQNFMQLNNALVKVPSPNRFQVEATGGYVAPITLSDGPPTDPAGLATQAGAQIIQLGINDSSLGTQTNARKGGFVRFASHPAFPMMSIFGRPAGSATLSQLARYSNNATEGTLELFALAGQTTAPLDLSQIGTVPNLKLVKTAIAPAGAVVQFKVQDETGAVFYIAAQAA